MKVPRDVDSSRLIRLLDHYGYVIVRQKGSHVRLAKTLEKGKHVITVPNHNPIKIGTLQSIARDICNVNGLDIQDFYTWL